MSPALGTDEADALAGAFEASWRTSIISFWYPRAIDPAGGYRVGWDARGEGKQNERDETAERAAHDTPPRCGADMIQPKWKTGGQVALTAR